MKKILLISLASIGLLASATYSSAQIIVWGSAQNMTGNSDVMVPGTLVDAATFYSSPVTVGTVTFNKFTVSSGTYTDGSGIAITTPSGGSGAYGSPFTTTTPSSTAYSHLTAVVGFTVGSTGTVTLSGLNTGDSYTVEAWSYYSGTAAGGSTKLTGSTSVNLLSTVGQFALGTFTATGSTETFGYAVNNADNHAVINAVSVFDDSGSTVGVPEPSTYVLLGVGALALVLVRRFKARA
jgi:hypothetical protein